MALAFVTGCDLYFGHGGDDDPCVGPPTVAVPPSQEVRNPNTGACELVGSPYPCDGVCGPCPDIAFEEHSWGACHSACSGLDELTCQATAGCFAAYFEDPAALLESTYWGCWQTAPSGPIPGTCTGLDAYQCSRHDDCIAIYIGHAGNMDSASFYACEPEPGPGKATCADVDCGPNYQCEVQCQGAGTTMTDCAPVCVRTLTCEALLCGPGTTCTEICTPNPYGQLFCEPTCVPDGGGDPGTCAGPVSCFANPPACPAGTVPGIVDGCWSGYCIPEDDCGPKDPGTCTGPVSCFANPPACPAGTAPGVVDGCWSGYCIPVSACGATACEAVADEASCVARGDCTPVYTGTGCTCTAGSCQCDTLTYDRCQNSWLL